MTAITATTAQWKLAESFLDSLTRFELEATAEQMEISLTHEALSWVTVPKTKAQLIDDLRANEGYIKPIESFNRWSLIVLRGMAKREGITLSHRALRMREIPKSDLKIKNEILDTDYASMF